MRLSSDRWAIIEHDAAFDHLLGAWHPEYFNARGPMTEGTGGEKLIGDGPQQISEPTDQIPGDTSTPYGLTIGGSQTGTINDVGDRDWFSINLVAGQSYVFTMTGSGTLSDTYLELLSPSGALIAIDDDGIAPGGGSLLRFTANTSGQYFIDARAFEDPSVENVGDYTVTAAFGPPQNPLDTIDLHYTAPLNIDVYFATSGQIFNGVTASRSWTTSEKGSAMAALATWAAVTPLTFSVVATSGSAEFILSLATLPSGVLGQFGTVGGIGYGDFAPTAYGWSTAGLAPGGAGFTTLIHEFGHGIGLAHPHDNGGGSEIMEGVLTAFHSYGDYLLNQGVFTVMSYNDGWSLGGVPSPTATGGNEATPGPLDIALVQQRYGLNATTNLGDTTYVLSDTVIAYKAIWDAGGDDSILYSGSAGTTIDLRAATLQNEIGGGGFVSFVAGVAGGFTIAHGVVIENASGGSNRDEIIGNDANNTLLGNAGDDVLSGNGGNDTLIGGDGADRLDGGVGADHLDGGAGDDQLYGGIGADTANYASASTSDSWHRNPDGSWTVVAGAEGTDTLSSVEFLHFTDRTVHLDNAFRTFSGDGTSDILFRSSSGDIVSWNVQGSSLTAASYITSASVSQWTPLGSGDFDGDGRDDMLWRQNDGLIYGWKMNGPTIVAGAGITGIGPEWTYLNTGDFNGDGHDDIAWRRSDGIVFTWDMNSPTSIASAGAIVGLGAEWSLQGVGDFNGDGRDDFLWRNTAGQTFIWEMNDRTISTAGATSAQVGTDWHVAGIGDFNGDGRDDILWQNSSGLVASWQMNGESVTGATFYGSVPAEWHIAQVGDYNGDGHDDILFKNDNGVIAVWMLDGTQIIGSGAIAGVGPEWGII